jgi:hypothetical protein
MEYIQVARRRPNRSLTYRVVRATKLQPMFGAAEIMRFYVIPQPSVTLNVAKPF